MVTTVARTVITMADMVVYCDKRPHEDRRVIVREFDRMLGDARWWELPAPERRRPKPDAQRLAVTVERDGTRDRRFRLECELCGLQATVRSETLWDLFDAAIGAGVSELRLTLIVTTLSGTEPRH
jgi:hypothetical protein